MELAKQRLGFVDCFYMHCNLDFITDVENEETTHARLVTVILLESHLHQGFDIKVFLPLVKSYSINKHLFYQTPRFPKKVMREGD